MLARRILATRLAAYYRQPEKSVVATLTEGDIHFKALWGEYHYRRLCARLYARQEGRWLTSVELMRPFYSQAVGNFVAAQAKVDGNHPGFDVVEIGGGRATNANLLLTHLQHRHPEIYDSLNSFIMIDASPSLLELQEKTMRVGDHFHKMKFELKDMIDVAEDKVPLLTSSDTPTILLACELLDNLPHDKVRARGAGLLEQAEIISSDGSPREVFAPLSDPLLASVLKLVPEYAHNALAWVPTVACGVLHRLHQDRPNSTLMLADFDWLPPPDETMEHKEGERSSTWASGEPIVTDMKGRDHPCYLQSPDHCDILFPTNFGRLASFVSKSWSISETSYSCYQVDVHKQSDFLQLYGPEQVQATKSWLTQFTPLLHDFVNCSVITVSHRTRRNNKSLNTGL